MCPVEFTVREDDGAAWFDAGRVVVNLRWLMFDWEAERYIVECFIHEYIEHVLGLGHETAVFVERVLRSMGE